LSWAWNIRGLVNDLLDRLIDNEEVGPIIKQNSNDIATSDTPSKAKKKKIRYEIKVMALKFLKFSNGGNANGNGQ
ncbi:2647_t:CDS:2, partial [Funneliformis geosporum]